MNRLRTRTSAMTAGLSAGALAAVVTLGGCSAGQVAQTAIQQPAINGTSVTIGGLNGVDLRNVHLRAAQTSDYVQPGSDVELLFVAVNGSEANGDRLMSISSDVGTVSLTGDTKLPAGGVLVVGTPDNQPTALDAVESADTVEATVALTKPISNGLNYAFTFTFEKAGQKTAQVPISAGEAPRREAAEDAVNDGEASSEGGH